MIIVGMLKSYSTPCYLIVKKKFIWGSRTLWSVVHSTKPEVCCCSCLDSGCM